MQEARRLAAAARYLTSVCTGSLVLGAAGLLQGKRAACHWAWRDMLPLFGAIPDSGRVVRDGQIITGGGVTAGMDFALIVAAELAGTRFAAACAGICARPAV
jgi:cyclohexyl-isocyanide hydratase